jgi:MYXO-CTERM domain-containing protein
MKRKHWIVIAILMIASIVLAGDPPRSLEAATDRNVATSVSRAELSGISDETNERGLTLSGNGSQSVHRAWPGPAAVGLLLVGMVGLMRRRR